MLEHPGHGKDLSFWTCMARSIAAEDDLEDARREEELEEEDMDPEELAYSKQFGGGVRNAVTGY